MTNATTTGIVTGGSIGFGRAVAGRLVQAGWTVVIDGRDRDAVAQAAAGTGAIGWPGDITDARHRQDLIDFVVSEHGGLGVLINNASSLGATPLPPIERYPLDELRSVFETNVIAPLALTQLALPLLAASGGAVINLTSDAAVEGYEGWGGYGASKAALEQIGYVLAVEQPGVRVWSVDPGDMRTRMHQDAFPGEDISDRPEPEAVAPGIVRLIEDRPPSGRIRLADLLEHS